jgi:hypothetical protein
MANEYSRPVLRALLGPQPAADVRRPYTIPGTNIVPKAARRFPAAPPPPPSYGLNRMQTRQADTMAQRMMRGEPAPAPAGPQMPPKAGIFNQPLMSPTGLGISSAALAGLEYGGPSLQPTSFGQGLARMGAAGLQAFAQAKQAEAASEMGERKLALDRMRLGTERLRAEAALQPPPKITAAMAEAEAMGFVRGTPEYNDYLKRRAEKPGTQIFMGGDKQKELAYKAALETRKVMQTQVGQDRELAARLQTVIDLLNSGVETGRVTSAMLPLKQIGRELGFLSDEQSQNLSELEIIDAATAFLTPRMRVVGSGASSDRDMDAFQRATVRMANTAEANLVIATMQKQVMDYNKRRLSLFDGFVDKEGHDFGFGEFADEKQGSVYQRVGTDEDFTKMIEDGQIKAGDVFFNALEGVNEFQIYDPEEMG